VRSVAQAFDITALVESISEKRDIEDKRKVRDVYLIDGTLAASAVLNEGSSVSSPAQENKIDRLKVAVYYDTKHNGEYPDFVKLPLEAKVCPKLFHFYRTVPSEQRVITCSRRLYIRDDDKRIPDNTRKRRESRGTCTASHSSTCNEGPWQTLLVDSKMPGHFSARFCCALLHTKKHMLIAWVDHLWGHGRREP
jgi:hypothetical protein